jgi:uncharacterized protein
MSAPGAARLPLFPLGLVLFPGLVLPLHVFEERYRVLVRELLELPPEQRRFGVVAIREGREVGADGVRALHEVGCVAQLHRAEEHADGRFDIVSHGADRFRLTGLEHDRPYLTGLVEPLPEDLGDADEAGVLARAVGAASSGYLQALARAGGEEVELGPLPDDPTVVSYLMAATVVVDLAERQALLALPDTRSRLRAELALLRRETTLLRRLQALPAPELTRTPLSLN